MVVAIGALLVKFKSIGFANVIGKTGKFQSKFGKMSKSVGPQLKKLTSGFKGLGLVATGVLYALTRASPRLAAEFEILNIRINQLIRPFGDELAPILRIVSDLINTLRTLFEALPEPIQQAILFGSALAVVTGVLAGAFAALSVAMSPVTLVLLGIVAAGALLYLAWETNFGGIRDVTESVFEAIKPLFEAIQRLFGGLGKSAEGTKSVFAGVFEFISTLVGPALETIGSAIENVILCFTGIVNFIDAIFKGDLEGALAAIGQIFSGIIGGWFDIIWLPVTWMQGMIEALTGTDILGDLVKAGQDLIGFLVKGIQKGIDMMASGLIEVIEWLAGFFGGSLPERGPLVGIKNFGEELGQTYILSVSSGLEGRAGNITRSLNIENVNMGFREEQMNTERTFFDGMDKGVRKSTSW